MMIKRQIKRSRRPPDALTIFLISDTHIHSEATSPDYPNLSNPPMYFYTGFKKLSRFVEEANRERPQAVIHLGDAVHSSAPNDSYDQFMSIWQMIDGSIVKTITPGNHDCSSNRSKNGIGLSIHDYIARKLGYENQPLVAGSKFNRSFSINKKGLSARIIMVDTNIGIDGGHTSVAPGYIHADARAWVESEIRSAIEQNIIVCAHKGRTYLHGADQTAFDLMVKTVLQDKPGVKLTSLYGHSHVDMLTRVSTNIPNYTIYNVPAFIDLNPGKFLKIYVSKSGDVSFRLGSAAWTPS